MATRKQILLPRSDIPGRAPTLNEIEFGEIAINTHDGKAYIKKEANGEVTIQAIGDDAVENVYYVSKSGQYGNDGRSLLNSFKTLDSAVSVVYAKQSFKFDKTLCERDLNVLMDGVRFDMALGTNWNQVYGGIAYRRGNSAKVTNEQLAATRQAINEERIGVISVPEVGSDVTAKSRANRYFEEVVDILVNGESVADELVFPAPITVVGTDQETAANLLQANKSFIQEEIVRYINSTELTSFDVQKCQRDVGLIIDAIKRDLLVGTNFWSVTAANAYLREESAYVLTGQMDATIAAVTELRNKIINDVGNPGNKITDSFQYILDVLGGIVTSPFINDPAGTITYPVTAGTYSGETNPNRANQRDAIVSARATLIADTSSFVQTNYPGLYDDLVNNNTLSLCERDTGFIIDGLIADLTYGGNTASRQSALAYYSGGVLQLGLAEAIPTVAAFTDLATRIKALPDVTEDSRVDELIQYITDYITNPSGINEEEINSNIGTYPNLTEYDLIQGNKVQLQLYTVDFVKETNPVTNFNQDKCYRDTGYIIDAILVDLYNGTDYNSIIAGIAYQRGNASSNKVQNDQLTYTIQAIEYLGNLIGNEISASGRSFVQQRITQITQLIQETSIYGYEDGDPIDFSGEAINFSARNAANALQANRRAIQRRLITWIQENYDTLEYNQDKCERDVGFLVDAVTHDILYGGGFAMRVAARSYWVGTDLHGPDGNLDGDADVWEFQLGNGERIATIDAYNELKNIMKLYVTTPTEQGRIDTLLDVLVDPVSGSLSQNIADTTKGETFQSSDFTDYFFVDDTDVIQSRKTYYQELTVIYSNDIFPTYSYNQTKCRRDVGYIVDGLTYDMMYGGNSATTINANAYFSVKGNGYLDLVGQNEIEASRQAYSRLRDVAGDVVAGIAISPSSGNNLSQSGIGSGAPGVQEARVESLVTIIYDVINAESNAGLTPIEQISDNDRPNLLLLGVLPALRTASDALAFGTDNRRTIINQTVANADNFGADTTIRLMSGDYTVNNPIRLPPKTAIVGDNLRTSTIRPASPDSDIFWVDNGCFLKDITFRDHQNGAACVAFDERDSVGNGTFITQSPYVQNCTSITSSGIGMRIDGSKVSGLRSMVADAFTQFNADGIGVKLMNRGYAQLVSIFTISTKTSILAETGGQCSITNSNSSFGDEGLVAVGGSPELYFGSLHANYNLNDDLIRVNNIINKDSYNYSLSLGDYKRPNYNDSIKFNEDSYYYTVLNVSDEITQNWAVSGNTEETELLEQAGTEEEYSSFGEALKISRDDNYMVVGVPKTQTGLALGSRQGIIEVFSRDETNWNFQQSIVPSSRGNEDAFGSVVDINKEGNVIAVGSPNLNNGSVFIFERDETTWTELQQITPIKGSGTGFQIPAGSYDEEFGTRLSLSGNGLVLAVSTSADGQATSRGQVVIYRRNALGEQFIHDSNGSLNGTGVATIDCINAGFTTLQPAVSLSENGNNLLIAWNGPASNATNSVFYYSYNQQTRNWGYRQEVIPTYAPYTGVATDHYWTLSVNDDTSYFVAGDAHETLDSDLGPGKFRQGVANTYTFSGGSWARQETIVSPSPKNNGQFGVAVDLNTKGDIALVGEIFNDNGKTHIVERAASNWEIISTLEPLDGGTNFSQYGGAVAAGGTSDYIATSAAGEDNTYGNGRGSVYTYWSILPETGSYELTIAPPLNKDAVKGQNTGFHQRSLITSSSHTFEYVGAGTNMFTAIPQNGGIPDKSKEVIFDSASTLTPNFGLVYFTATDELGDFRIGGELTINRESGTITGTTFDRSLFAVLTPYILALEG